VLFLRKHGAKMFFAIACVLFAVSLCFSAYSLAQFVSHAEIDGGAGAAGINCGYTVNKGGGTFINAPFMLKVSEETEAVRMNDWAESEITVYNNGKVGLKYEFSFVLYLPRSLAECAMFQLVELEEGSEVQTGGIQRVYPAVRASKLYMIDTNGSLKVTDRTAPNDYAPNGVEIQNDYADYIDRNKEITVETGKPAAFSAGVQPSNVTRTYTTYSAEQAARYVCPITLTETEEIEFIRVTLNISAKESPSDYVLDETENASKRFLLRLSLRAAVDEKNFAGAWGDNDKHAGHDVTVPDKYGVRWNGNVLEIKEPGTDEFKPVTVQTCMGLISPSRMSVVFTQKL